MNELSVQYLIDSDIVPHDSEIVSTHNNVIIRSRKAKTISRIANRADMISREDPGNLEFSHELSWEVGEAGGVLTPVESSAQTFEDYIISTYPLLSTDKTWTPKYISEVAQMLDSFNHFNIATISDRHDFPRLDIFEYASKRLEYVDVHCIGSFGKFIKVRKLLEEYQSKFPIDSLTEALPGLIHGDIHSGNIVNNQLGEPFLIDLDSTAIGPLLYDQASWLFRQFRGEKSPVDRVVKYDMINGIGRSAHSDFRALIGWKALSSMTHVLRHSEIHTHEDELAKIFKIMKDLKAPI